jgi:hypothetical protein
VRNALPPQMVSMIDMMLSSAQVEEMLAEQAASYSLLGPGAAGCLEHDSGGGGGVPGKWIPGVAGGRRLALGQELTVGGAGGGGGGAGSCLVIEDSGAMAAGGSELGLRGDAPSPSKLGSGGGGGGSSLFGGGHLDVAEEGDQGGLPGGSWAAAARALRG